MVPYKTVLQFLGNRVFDKDPKIKSNNRNTTQNKKDFTTMNSFSGMLANDSFMGGFGNKKIG